MRRMIYKWLALMMVANGPSPSRRAVQNFTALTNELLSVDNVANKQTYRYITL